MKAIRVHRFGEPEVLGLEEMPIPVPAPRQVLVRMLAIGVNPVDTYIRSGNYARKPALPYTPGGDGAGLVEKIGDQVAGFKPGNRVYTAGTISGSYAELAVCDSSQVFSLPEAVSFAQGAAIGVPYATAYRALVQRARAGPGESVLVHGASGGVGLAAVQLARSHGLQVWGTAGSEQGRRLVSEQGAHHVFDHGAPNYVEQISRAIGDRGIDIILEMQANRNLAKDLTLLAHGGRVVVIGSRGRVEIDPRDAMNREADIRGMGLFNASPAEISGIHAALFDGFAKGTLRPVVSRQFPLADAALAHATIMKPGASGKIILIP